MYTDSDEKFQAYGAVERQKLNQLCDHLGISVRFEMGSKAPFDMLGIYKAQIVMMEAKVRNVPSDRYDSMMLEKSKYDRLNALVEQNVAMKIWYINFFNDNTVLIFNLVDDGNHEWIKQKLVKNTALENAWIEKTITYLDNSKAIKIIL